MQTSTSAHRIARRAGADRRRNGDDYPMTSLSDGLGPQKDPNSGRTRVQSGPAGPHRPTTRRGSAIAQPSVPRAQAGDGGPRPETETSAHRHHAGETWGTETSAHRIDLARRGCGPARAIVMPDAPPAIAARVDVGPSHRPGAPRVRAGPNHRHARRAAGDRGPWVSLPLRATIPEGNTVGQHADVDVGPSHRSRHKAHRPRSLFLGQKATDASPSDSRMG